MICKLTGVIRVLINRIHFIFLNMSGKKISCQGKCTSRLDNEWAVSRGAGVKLGYHFASLKGCRFLVRNGLLEIGDNVGLNSNCIIACHKNIVISEGVEIGPNVCIYDHDHDFRCENGIKAGKYICDDVYIGKNTWIGANVVILKGSHIGDNCVIGAGSVIFGYVPNNTLVIQKRDTALKTISLSEGVHNESNDSN